MKADKYVPPHLRNEETRQSVSKMPSETENTPSSQIDEINKKTDKYVPPHLRNKETRQSVSKMPSETENTPTNPVNTQIDENNKKVDQYVLSHLKIDESNQSVSTMPFETKIISPATASSSSLVICNWKTKRVIKLLRRYTKYKAALSRPDVKEAKEQTLWRKIAYDSDLSLSRDKIDELRCEYERIKNMNVRNRETAMFLDEAKIAFETTENTEKAKPVKMLDFKKSNKDFLRKLLQVYAKHKTEACPYNEEQIVWEKITKEMREKFSYACGEKLCRFELLQLKCQYESSKRKKIKYGNMIYLFQDAKEAFEISENLVISSVTASSSLPVYCSWEMKTIIKLLRLYTNYKPEFSHPDIEEQTVWKKIAQELQEQNYDESEQNYDESECHNKINELRCVYEGIINKNVTNRETAMFLDEAKKAFDTTEITEESKPLLLLGIKKSNKDFLRKLLKVYAKYKTELACPKDEEQKVWEKIAKEMREKFSYVCGETLCRFELLELKCQYESSKRWKITNGNMFYLFHDAEEAFETPENLDVSNSQIDEINKKVDENVPPHLSNEENSQSVSTMPSETEIISSVVNASSSLSQQNCSWNKKRIFKVLQLYTKYKAELSHPDIKKINVWKKIAHELRNCDELQCFNKIYELRCEYERIKNENVTNRETAIFLDEAKKAFETAETTGETKPLFMLSLKRSNKDLLRKLLQVYSKYKTELACHNNNEGQKVWERIAKEMREKFSYSCGETLCRFELLQLKFQYESLKRDGVKSENMIYLFHDAEEAFETAENLDTSNSQIDEINKKVDEYLPPHLNNEENRQSVSTTPSETESIPAVNLCKLPSKNGQWKRKQCLVLLRVYTKYKTELSCSSVEENHEVWKKIAKEVCRSFNCNELQCMDNIDKLKREYFALKFNPKTAVNDKITLFLNEASNAFETSGNSGLQR